MKVGFIGLGVMGRPMALHLAQAGHELHVWARRPHSTVGLPLGAPGGRALPVRGARRLSW